MKSYTFQLLEGSFSKEEAVDLLTRMVHAKIKHHENKINDSENEEDVKRRENKIKQLQKGLYEALLHIGNRNGKTELNSEISIQ